MKPQLKLSFSFISNFSPPPSPPGKVFKAQLELCASRFEAAAKPSFKLLQQLAE